MANLIIENKSLLKKADRLKEGDYHFIVEHYTPRLGTINYEVKTTKPSPAVSYLKYIEYNERSGLHTSLKRIWKTKHFPTGWSILMVPYTS